MKKRFIFNLDETLLHGNYKWEQNYFRRVLSKEDADRFLSLLFPMLEECESKYEISKLSKYLTEKSNIKITDQLIQGWIDINYQMGDKFLPETIEMLKYLKYLKSKGKNIVVLTSWLFYKRQYSILENKGISSYFDEIYSDDLFFPSEQTYLIVKGEYNIDECVVISDTIEKDVLGPKMIGMDSIYYNPSNKPYNKNLIYSIDSFEKIKEMY